jgi:hypothetical protein
MNLCDARIDLRGRIVALGRLTFTGDPDGHFVPIDHDCIRMAAKDESIRLAAATASRDEASGFLVAQEVAPVVVLPRALSLLIRDALEHQPVGSVAATLAKQEGRLDSNSSPEESWSQPLSDWTLEIVADGEELKFNLSAALLAIDPLKAWQKRTGNYWPIADHGPSPRLQIGFSVDAATRIAMFGTLFPELTKPFFSELPQVHVSTATKAANPRLSDAPVGINGEIFGYGTDGSWVSIFEGRDIPKMLALDRYRPQKRFSNGFVSVDRVANGPRLWIAALGMTQIVEALLGNSRKGSVELKDGHVGFVQGDHQSANPMISIGAASIDLLLTPSGLEFSYNFSGLKSQANQGPWSGSFVIPWEIVILRYPRLANYRLKILA